MALAPLARSIILYENGRSAVPITPLTRPTRTNATGLSPYQPGASTGPAQPTVTAGQLVARYNDKANATMVLVL